MRRPVKPFVTEYRGGTRRHAGGGQAAKPDLSAIEPEPPAAEPRPAMGRSADPSEDSYEAALRAADALFSARPSGAVPSPAGAEADTEPSAPAPHSSGGRVFRVLDEPPSPELLRLEAERAPKRRGRKPGSKNKPKPVASVLALEAVDAPPAEESVVPAPAMAAPMRPAVVPLAHAALVAAGAATPRAGEKYAWVRTKLKPGQQWKRRLPKVAW